MEGGKQTVLNNGTIALYDISSIGLPLGETPRKR